MSVVVVLVNYRIRTFLMIILIIFIRIILHMLKISQNIRLLWDNYLFLVDNPAIFPTLNPVLFMSLWIFRFVSIEGFILIIRKGYIFQSFNGGVKFPYKLFKKFQICVFVGFIWDFGEEIGEVFEVIFFLGLQVFHSFYFLLAAFNIPSVSDIFFIIGL